MIEIILLIAILFVLGFIFIELSKKPLFAFFAKGVASFGFIFLAFYGIYLKTSEALSLQDIITFLSSSDYIPIMGLFILGLVCGLLGDLYLALRPLRPKKEDGIIIISGIVCFSFGHLFYLFALLKLSELSYLSIIISIGITAFVYIMMIKLKFEMGITKWPVMFYSLLIFLMIGQAFVYALQVEFTSHALVIFIGAVLFGISDLILAPIYFKNKQSNPWIASNLLTYYAAQILIAFSLYLL